MKTRCIPMEHSQLWAEACCGLGLWVYGSAELRTGCQRRPGIVWHSLSSPRIVYTLPGSGLGGRDEALRDLALGGFGDEELGYMRKREDVGAESAKKISKPSSSFDGSCPGIMMQDPGGNILIL